MKATEFTQGVSEEWSKKYKDSINCSNPKGFSQRAHCAGRKKNEDVEAAQQCPECGGPMFSDLLINEKQDACYYKVKSRYKVWPSAYASGALVQCRKKGAKNWGNKSESTLEENLRNWFKEKWVRFGPDGKIRGDCARGDDSEGKPKCLPQSKAHSLGKKGRASAASRKRREDPNPERSGPAINVNTKKKSNEGVTEGDRIARKPGQPANSKKHSDLYTDENPKGTITGLKFATVEDARASVSKIRKSGRSHAHKIQAAVAMEQRARAAGKTSEAAVYRSYINSVKKSNEGVTEGSDKKEATRRIQKMLNTKFGANLDVDGILGPLTLKSINKFMPSAKIGLANEPNKTTAVQGKKEKTSDQLDELKCWPGYSRVQGVPAGAPGSCKKKTNEQGDKIGGRYDPEEFDAIVDRLKKLAAAGPMKTVWDPVKRVYKNVPVAQQTQKSNK